MLVLTLRRRRLLLHGRGISSLADVPTDPHSKMLASAPLLREMMHRLRSAPPPRCWQPASHPAW